MSNEQGKPVETLEDLLAWAGANGATVTLDGPGRATLSFQCADELRRLTVLLTTTRPYTAGGCSVSAAQLKELLAKQE